MCSLTCARSSARMGCTWSTGLDSFLDVDPAEQRWSLGPHWSPMRFGMMSLSTSWREAQRDAARAAEFGFDFLATGDHLRHPPGNALPVLDGWSVLAALAATTDRLRLRMLVTSIVFVRTNRRLRAT
jgi:hypothetical protein